MFCLNACLWFLLGASAGAEGVVCDPPAWNFGVRPREHLITKVIRLRPVPGGARVRIARVRTSCECLHVKLLRDEGTRELPAEIEAVMDTERFSGRFRKSVFIALGAPGRGEIVLPVTGWITPERGPGRAEVFFAASEPSGERFLAWWRTIVGSREGAERVRLLPIEEVENYRRLRELERASGLRGPAPDVIAFVEGGIVLRGEEETRAGLTGFLNLDSDGRPDPSPRPGHEETAPARRQEAASPASWRAGTLRGPVEVQLFYFSNCRGCREALTVMRGVERERRGEVRLTVFDTARDPDSVPRVFAMAELYACAPKVLPSMMAFVGDELLLGPDEIVSRASALVEKQLRRGGEHLRVRTPDEAAPFGGRAEALEVLPVILAALADGVNPCAFAAMVLLVAVLSAAGLSGARRELVLGGGAFCAGVFVTYYLAGLALFAGVRGLRGLPAAEAIVFWVVWALAVAGGCLSAWDAAVWFRTGDPDRVRLKVPEVLRRRFAPLLRGRFRRSGLVLGGLTGGVLIAVLEGVCTGQMYLPAIQYMAATEGLRARGAVYLLVYNGLFVMPLVAILGAAVAGVHFRRLSGFLRRHLGGAKLALAAVFFLLAAGMILGR